MAKIVIRISVTVDVNLHSAKVKDVFIKYLHFETLYHSVHCQNNNNNCIYWFWKRVRKHSQGHSQENFAVIWHPTTSNRYYRENLMSAPELCQLAELDTPTSSLLLNRNPSRLCNVINNLYHSHWLDHEEYI